MKVNQKRNVTVSELSNVINNCEFLLRFDIEIKGSGVYLIVETDTANVEYRESSQKGMITFLHHLKSALSNNQEDVDSLISELMKQQEGRC